MTRFGLVEGDINNTRLFVLTNPVGKMGKRKAFLQLWLPEDGSLKRSVPCGDTLSALAVSDDGKFAAVGTMFSGSVSVYIAFSLQVQFLISIVFFSLTKVIVKQSLSLSLMISVGRCLISMWEVHSLRVLCLC